MLKQLQKTKDQKGFTIIEVLIVLAIAALILVVVLIAVPNLQRNQRNSARKDEASRILTAANNYVSNNNGTPLVASNLGEAKAILADAGTLQQYSTVAAAGGNSYSAGKLNVAVGAVSAPANPSGDGIVIAQGGTCDTTTPGQVNAASNSRQVVIMYTLETTGGFSVACIGG